MEYLDATSHAYIQMTEGYILWSRIDTLAIPILELSALLEFEKKSLAYSSLTVSIAD